MIAIAIVIITITIANIIVNMIVIITTTVIVFGSTGARKHDVDALYDGGWKKCCTSPEKEKKTKR